MNLKPTHKAIKTFHTALGGYNAQDVTHELAVKTAFQTLLADTARARKWLLVPELTMRHRGRHIRPDGVLRDEFAIPRGYWETKDTHDDVNGQGFISSRRSTSTMAKDSCRLGSGIPRANEVTPAAVIGPDTIHKIEDRVRKLETFGGGPK